MDIRSTRINLAPINGLGIRVDPEEPLVPAFGMSLPDGLARILVQELADHRLRDRMDDIGVRARRRPILVPIRAAEPGGRTRRRSNGPINRPHGVLLGGKGRGDGRASRRGRAATGDHRALLVAAVEVRHGSSSE